MPGASGSLIQPPDFFPFRRFAQKFLPSRRIRDLYCRAQQPVNRSLLQNVLSEMEVEYRVSASDLASVPARGGVVIVSNHPFGVLDGTVLGAMIESVRPDVKIMANSLLAGIPELHECCYFVDPFGRRSSVLANQRALRRAAFWLRRGGALVVFPAGEVSLLRVDRMQVADPQWSTVAVTLARLTHSPVLPVYLPGQSSAAFQGLRLLHPRLRSAWLMHEFLGQRGKRVEVRVGSAVPALVLKALGDERDATRYLRWRTYLLARRRKRPALTITRLPLVAALKKQEKVAQPAEPELLRREMADLGPDRCLEKGRDFHVYGAAAAEVPHLMRELGRLREISFRAAGEGSGKALDLDRFDGHYKHLLLWNSERRQLVGGYRLGRTDEILPHAGVDGLYTSTLFRYKPPFFDRLGPALELGRSFIRPEYQKQYAPLLALWKGIGSYLAAHPEIAVLFGAVSISQHYSRVSRDLIFRFFQSRDGSSELAQWVRPRQPFRPNWTPFPEDNESCSLLRDPEHLTGPITDLESDRKGMPVLLRHYVRLGGRLLTFNVDRKFSNVLDGLVMVDLRTSDPIVLQRYMGKEGVARFREFHGLDRVNEPRRDSPPSCPAEQGEAVEAINQPEVEAGEPDRLSRRESWYF